MIEEYYKRKYKIDDNRGDFSCLKAGRGIFPDFHLIWFNDLSLHLHSYIIRFFSFFLYLFRNFITFINSFIVNGNYKFDSIILKTSVYEKFKSINVLKSFFLFLTLRLI